ncbi:hypothetical protein POTOM_040532 [Populus tomentosa]|uniref:U-box domain-containing protein n=1 Tax=Populus tomentosa TaxID=118781 RepID=A0A8X7YKX0_POPTO|nr:hypothetical protein POTOM_040532 [Populus tomentosa]
MATHLPDDFKCPISLEIMSDPVILSSGHTFDRSSIQRWLDSGHRTCPITKLPLPEHPCLIPNHALRSLISSFTIPKSQPDPNPCRNLNPDQSKKYQTQLLIYTLVSPSSTLESKLHSLSQLTRLTKLDSGPRRQLTESGAVSAVLNCVNSTESEIQEKALALLLNLSLDDDNKVGLVAEGVISRVINVIRAGSANSRAIGCTILTSLAVVEVNKATIGAYPNAIKTLIWVLYSGKGREVREAATALYAICSFVDNRKRAVECGAVPILMKIGGMGLERAVEVLSLLVKCKEGREEMRKVNGCLEVLVKVIRNGSERGVQCALLTLSCLCCFAEEMRVEAEKEGVLEICVGFLDDENEKIRRHASSLVQTLSVFLILMLAKEYYLNCKFIDMATVSVLSSTAIEDSLNAKGNNKICLKLQLIGIFNKFASSLLSFLPTDGHGAFSIFLNASIDLFSRFRFSDLAWIAIVCYVETARYESMERFNVLISNSCLIARHVDVNICRDFLLVPQGFLVVVAQAIQSRIVFASGSCNVSPPFPSIKGSILSQLSSQNIIVYGLFGSNAYKLKDYCMLSTYMQHIKLKSTVKLLLPHWLVSPGFVYHSNMKISGEVGNSRQAWIKVDELYDGKVFTTSFWSVDIEHMLSSEEPLNLANAKVGIELYAKMLYYLIQKSVAFGTWNMIGLYRTFMVIGISCLVRTGQK